jgi:transcription initiation factor TFIIIB Brf1 subunit/transcription initiation factor TFIIB
MSLISSVKNNYISSSNIIDSKTKNNLFNTKIEYILDDCIHDTTIEDAGVTLCISCGIEIRKDLTYDKDWRYYGKFDTKNSKDPNRVHARKCEDKNIFKDVEDMNFTSDIVADANEIYLQITEGKIKRGTSRKAIIFACIFEAYNKKGNIQIPNNLIKTFNITRKEGLQGRKFLELKLPKEKLRNESITPEHIIIDILSKFDASKEQTNQVINLYNSIKNKHTLLNRARPQSVAAGITFYWFEQNKINMTIKDFSKKVNLSELTIIKICDIIKEILNHDTL